ncbi:MAG: tetraacyldisaccharide 4'-kinase [Terracidiphilus sp.]
MRRPLMLPLIPLYAAGLALRELRLSRGWEPIRRLRNPVISIGNLSTGGSGKTPFTITLARLLSARGFHVDVLSRGYGRSSGEPARVLPHGTAEQYGDEPLLIAREAGVPVYVAAERYDAGLLAESNTSSDAGSPQAHILDDGFQHRQLSRDIDILLVNREDWHDHLLPVGNLRETLNAVRRASALAIPKEDSAFEGELRAWGWTGPIWRIRRRMEIPQVSGPVVAFCGIARPSQFFAGLEADGISLASRVQFPDHHRYTPRDIEKLIATARSKAATSFITTEKDEVRLASLASAFPSSLPLKAARLTLTIEDESQVSEWLACTLRTNQTLQSL